MKATRKARYVVQANAPSNAAKTANWNYPPGYFPRTFHYEKEAIDCAEQAIINGATMARIERPDGSEHDFYPAGKPSDVVAVAVSDGAPSADMVKLFVTGQHDLPPENERAFIVVNQFGWAKAQTIRQAVQDCKRNNPADLRAAGVNRGTLTYRAFLVHKDADCDGLGGINRPQQFPPLSLGIVA